MSYRPGAGATGGGIKRKIGLGAIAGAGGRLDHQREPDRGSKVGRRRGRFGQPVPGAGHARGVQHGLHLVLVPEVAGRGRVHAGDAQVLADLGQRHLELLEHGQQPLHRAQRPGQTLDGPGDLAGVERVGPVALDLLRRFAPPRPVRLLGVRVAGLETMEPDAAEQLSLAF